MNISIVENGVTTAFDGAGTWTCNRPDQAAKHISTWRDAKRNGDAAPLVPTIADGDVSAIMDCHADAQRQVAASGRYTPTKKWIYKNDGTVVQVIGATGQLAPATPADAPTPAADPSPEDIAAAPSLMGKLWRFFRFME